MSYHRLLLVRPFARESLIIIKCTSRSINLAIINQQPNSQNLYFRCEMAQLIIYDEFNKPRLLCLLLNCPRISVIRVNVEQYRSCQV